MAAIWGKVICYPCELCGTCCKESCTGCFNCCTSSCKSLTAIFWPQDKPSPIFLIFSILAAGLPGMISFFIGLIGLGVSCDQHLAAFLIINGLVCLTWVGFAIHLYMEFGKPYQLADNLSNPMYGVNSSPMSRGYHMLYNDPFVCVMMLILPFSVVWSIVGLVWVGVASDCGGDLRSNSAVFAIFTMCYLAIGAGIIMLSMMCDCCRFSQDVVTQDNPAAPLVQQAFATDPKTLIEAGAGMLAGFFGPKKDEPPMSRGDDVKVSGGATQAPAAGAYPLPPNYGSSGKV